MNIPCPTCARPNECRRDHRCNLPKTMDSATREAIEACAALKAAAERLNAAIAALGAVMAIEGAK